MGEKCSKLLLISLHQSYCFPSPNSHVLKWNQVVSSTQDNYSVAADRMVSKKLSQPERYLGCQLGTKKHRHEVDLPIGLVLGDKIRASQQLSVLPFPVQWLSLYGTFTFSANLPTFWQLLLGLIEIMCSIGKYLARHG